MHRDKFLIIKPTRCTNFLKFILEWNSTCFGEFLCPSSGIFHCTHNNVICHTGLLIVCVQEHLLLLTSCQHNLYDIPLLCVQWKTPDDGQRNCPKHEFHSKNKFEKISASSWFYYKKYSNTYQLLIKSYDSPISHCTTVTCSMFFPQTWFKFFPHFRFLSASRILPISRARLFSSVTPTIFDIGQQFQHLMSDGAKLKFVTHLIKSGTFLSSRLNIM